MILALGIVANMVAITHLVCVLIETYKETRNRQW